MTGTTPKFRNFAASLLAQESKGGKSPALFLVCEKLRPHLSTLMGSAGFRALLTRALVLALPEMPWLQAAHVKADGALGGLDELEAQIGAKEFAGGSVELLAQLFGLLTAFIGENLTLRLLREAWPNVSFNDGNGDKGDKNEKTK